MSSLVLYGAVALVFFRHKTASPPTEAMDIRKASDTPAPEMARASSTSARLARLLAEPLDAVIEREATTLDDKIGSLDRDFVLFGAGNLGRKVLRTLERIGRKPVAFLDNNPALRGTDLLGVPIYSPSEFAGVRNPASVGVITTIWCGEATDKMSDRLDPLRKLGFKDIALFGHLAWKFPEEFLPHYSLDRPSLVIAQADRIQQAHDRLSDEASRELFVDHVEWRLWLDYDLLPPASPELIYFNPVFANVNPDEVLYDIGAYIGDSVEDFMKTPRAASFAGIHSFEPSSRNFAKLEHYAAGLESQRGRVFAHKMALGAEAGTIEIEEDHGPASRVGHGGETVNVSTIDTFAQGTQVPTFIKIDIEGFEPQCLEGGRRTIAQSAPVVAVCVYHVQSHLWDILLQLHSYYPHYTFRLCPHLADGWDLVLYAVPAGRVPA